MSSSRMSTNGASLEDCQTNVFALTELNGLKWKCVTTPQSHRGWISIEQDPVLSAYAKCLQSGILCAWRRQPTQIHNTLTQIPLPDYRIDVVKELWVFWYSQDEPELLTQYTSHLACGENGRGNWATAGIPYEVRTLYFKALHNLIERSLIKSGYIRIGRFFVHPYDFPSSDRLHCLPSYILGISFNFFVHGENIVCTCVNVQKQPAIFRLSAGHLELREKQPVILGPWSLRAHLIPRQADLCTFSSPLEKTLPNDQGMLKQESSIKQELFDEALSFDSQQHPRPHAYFDGEKSFLPNEESIASKVDKLWSEWELFFGLSNETKVVESVVQKPRQTGFFDEIRCSSKQLPRMVLVDVDGVRMWFPRSLVVVQAADDLLLKNSEVESTGEDVEENGKIFNIGESEEVFPKVSGASLKASEETAQLSGTISPSLFRKRQRKRRERELQEPARKHRNLMFNAMVNGTRDVQRYLGEACILSAWSRRRESFDPQSSSNTFANKNEDDTKWNLTDGIRGAECDNEQHTCSSCHAENPSRTPIPSTSSNLHYGMMQPSRGSPCNKMFYVDDHILGRSRGFQKSHRYHCSPSRLPRSPSPFSSSAQDTKYERSSPDLIFDPSYRASSLIGVRGLSDSFDDIPRYPSSPSFVPDSHVYRRVVHASGAFSKRLQSPMEGNKSRKDSIHLFSSEPVDDLPSCSQVIMPSDASYHQNLIVRRSKESFGLAYDVPDIELKCFVPKRRTRNFFAKQKRKIENKGTVATCDTALLTTRRKENWMQKEWVEKGGISLETGTLEVYDTGAYKDLEKAFVDGRWCSKYHLSRETTVDSTVFSRTFGVLNDTDYEGSQCIRSASPSTFGVVDAESMGVADSVHLSPPASNERVEPMFIPSNLSGSVTNNLLARVGGPPSVGDYKIYPTPPSVDAIQSQQFSPQSALQTCGNTVFYTSAAQYGGLSQSSNNNSLYQPLSAHSSVATNQLQENLVILKDESDPEPVYGLQGKLTGLTCQKLPLFGKGFILNLVLCGKYGEDVFKSDPFHRKHDQQRSNLTSIFVKMKRKQVTDTPFYQPLRQKQKSREHRFLSFDRSRIHFGSTLSSSLSSLTSSAGQLVNHNPVPVGTGGIGMPLGGTHGMVNSAMGNLNSSLPMPQMRPARPHSLAYSPSTSGMTQPGFLSPPAYGVSSLMSSTSTLESMHGSPMAVTPQGMGLMPSHSPSMMSSGVTGHPGMNLMHGGLNTPQQQPFQQLSQFVNNANFSNQGSNAYEQQHFYQQQMLSRGNMQGNMTAQPLVPSPGGYSLDSQISTPIEPPPPFSQAMGNQYSSSPIMTNATPSLYGQSSQMMRGGSLIGSGNSPLMSSGSRPMVNSMMIHTPTSNAFNNAMYNQRHPNVMQGSAIGNLPALPPVPEGNSLTLAVLLQDTVLDLHYDSAFDACPLCSCNGNIRTKELGMYITPPEVLRQSSSLQNPVVNKPTSGFYISNNSTQNCNCGFSAIRHRYLSMKAGLFPEDAKEATDITDSQSQPEIPRTIWFDPISKKDIDFIALLCEQTLMRDLSGFLDHVSLFATQCERAVQSEQPGSDMFKKAEYFVSDVDKIELSLVFQAACEVACMEMNCRPPRRDVPSVLWHDWGVQMANEMYEPKEAECVAVLKEVGPVLEETLRKARSAQMGGSNNIVEGPLTWRHFDRKSLKTGAGIEDDSLPEPIPNLLMASEKDAISASPQILRLWEHMLLEPFDQPKDVLYIAVVPDNLVCVEKAKKYFDDFSRFYEQCRFGRHIPFAKEPLKDGFLRIPTRLPATHPNDFLKQFEAHMINEASLIPKLSAYMQFVENELSEVVNKNSYIFSRESYRALLMENHIQDAASSSVPATSTACTNGNDQMLPPAFPGIVSAPVAENNLTGLSAMSGPSSVVSLGGCKAEPLTPTNAGNEVQNQVIVGVPPQIPEQIAEGFGKDEPGTLPHVIVLYLVNPFLMGADESPLVARVVTVALMRAFTALLDHIDLRHRPQLQMEIIGLQSIFDYCGTTIDMLKDECGQLNGMDQGRMERTFNERLSSMDAMKTYAFSVYSQSRILLPEVVGGILPTSMTRFGPVSAMNDLLEKLGKNDNPVFYKVPSKPFILAQPPPVILRPNNELMQISAEETVLFVSYCLIGLDFLAATVTDHQGHLLDNCLINLRLKPDHKRGNMRYKQSTQIRDSLYRLWSFILGTLATGTKNWRLVIGKVGRIGHGEFKFWTQLLSKSYLKQVPSRMKQACRPCHQTPGTAEVPGVLSACLVSLEPEPYLRVFPSFFQHDERFAKNARYRNLNTPDDATSTHILVFPTSPELNLDHQGGAGGNDYDDLSIMLEGDLPEEFSSIIAEDLNLNATGQSAGLRMAGNTGIPTEYTDVFENQPLAAGYYISTAPASELPEWFWSSCPSAKRRNPVHLKSSLHLNTNNVQQGDDITLSVKGSETCQHQLDSQSTVDVLRYVLETYNALSWLNMDLVTGERRSCLPVHIQALMRLCNTVDRLIN